MRLRRIFRPKAQRIVPGGHDRVRFHPDAQTDFEEIWDYIAEDNADAADRVIGDVLAAVRALVSLPYQGHRRIDPNVAPSAVFAGA